MSMAVDMMSAKECMSPLRALRSAQRRYDVCTTSLFA